MSRRMLCLLLAAVLVAAFVRPARADIDAEQVRASIDRGVAFLKSQQQLASGAWPDYKQSYVGGTTALCTLALLNSGVESSDEKVQAALAALRTLKPTSTYVTSLQTMVFCAAEPQKDMLLIKRNVDWLQAQQIPPTGARPGAWSYPSGAAGGDNSNSQFALLALYEAERAGVTIRPETWRAALDYWQDAQNPDGSWGYWPKYPGSGSMTCAGITSLIITAGELNGGDAKVVGGKVKCCGQQQADGTPDRVERGIRWLEKNFSLESNPGRGPNIWGLYYLYGFERVGRMTARRFIGEHDWYREGADHLIRKQDRLSGFWVGGPGEDDKCVATSFALLFLAKGRRPVLVGKLKHGPADDWNHHRNDLANLTRYVETRWHRDLTWQVIDVARASVEDLLQAPVLFFDGREAPEFTDEQKKNLRDYVDRGGFLFAEACCGGESFDDGFRKLMGEIFPEEEHRLRLLPPEHPIWSAEEPVNPKYLRPLWGIDVGCRTSVVYCPKDLSCYWELSRTRADKELPAKVREEVAAVNRIGINVLAYATNRELLDKSAFFRSPEAEPAADPLDRGQLRVAKLLHAGGCNAAPAALGNLLRVAADKLKIRVSTEPRDLSLTDPKLFNYSIVFMHGRHNFRFTPAERKQLKAYLERGGVLFADSICSSREFTEAFRREMKLVLPEQPLARIPVKHPLFSADLGGDDLSTVSRRVPESRQPGAPLKAQQRQVEPYLEGLQLGDRYAVIFSPYDLSCALESRDTLECEGYTRKDAARIGLNVLLYSLHQ